MSSELNLKLLGAKTPYIFEYNKDLLEAFPNPNPNLDPLITLECKEFTSLCPITSQPDFGAIYIRYIPKDKMVESKSLK
ncbi:preQ(1) synthase, partial [Helicobacter pylori]